MKERLVEGTERVEVARKKTLELHGGHGPGIHPGVIARTSLAIAIMILHYRALQGTTTTTLATLQSSACIASESPAFHEMVGFLPFHDSEADRLLPI